MNTKLSLSLSLYFHPDPHYITLESILNTLSKFYIVIAQRKEQITFSVAVETEKTHARA